MIDQRVELRLRDDPTGDPIHEVGRFRERMAMAAGVRSRPGPVVAARPVAALLAAALVVALVLVVRPLVQGPGETPSPTPTNTPLPTLESPELEAVVSRWMLRFGQVDPPPISVSVVGLSANKINYSAGALPADPPSASAAYIGEISRVHLAAAIALIDHCTRQVGAFSCQKPIFPTTMRLDDPVAQWYDGWPGADPTTVRQLFDGTSGIAAVGPTMAELADRIAAAPGADWSPSSLIAAALAAPRRFAPGSAREAVDTEWMILEAIVERASSRASTQVIPTEGYPPFSTSFADQATSLLMSGSRPTGDPVAGLDPALGAAIRNAGAMASSSDDLAEMALTVWGGRASEWQETVDLLTDAANGRANPPGATAECPCDVNDVPLLIRVTGHAVGWTAVMAWSYEQQTGIGIVLGRDWRDDDIEALLHELTTIPVR